MPLAFELDHVRRDRSADCDLAGRAALGRAELQRGEAVAVDRGVGVGRVGVEARCGRSMPILRCGSTPVPTNFTCARTMKSPFIFRHANWNSSRVAHMLVPDPAIV